MDEGHELAEGQTADVLDVVDAVVQLGAYAQAEWEL